MPLNLLKTYSELLDIAHLAEGERTNSLKRIFKRDIEDNPSFKFREKVIRPIKGEEPNMQHLFTHLTHEAIEEHANERGSYKRRVFEFDRSVRLHWIWHHIQERIGNLQIFSTEERDQRHRKDIIRTYIYDITEEYVIVLEPQRSKSDYYLLTAYHLNKPEGKKSIEKKYRKRLQEVH